MTYDALGTCLSDEVKLFDNDESGELDIKEFRFLIKKLRLGLTDDRILALFRTIDVDHGGTIDDKEFVRLFSPRIIMPPTARLVMRRRSSQCKVQVLMCLASRL